MKHPVILGWIPEWRIAQEEDEYCQLILLRLEALDSRTEGLHGKQQKMTLSPTEDNLTSLDGGIIGTR
jgi:hypothetical protein